MYKRPPPVTCVRACEAHIISSSFLGLQKENDSIRRASTRLWISKISIHTARLSFTRKFLSLDLSLLYNAKSCLLLSRKTYRLLLTVCTIEMQYLYSLERFCHRRKPRATTQGLREISGLMGIDTLPGYGTRGGQTRGSMERASETTLEEQRIKFMGSYRSNQRVLSVR